MDDAGFEERGEGEGSGALQVSKRCRPPAGARSHTAIGGIPRSLHTKLQ